MSTERVLNESEAFATAITKVEAAVEETDRPERAVRRLLELGEELLDVENAHLTQIDPAANHWKAIESTDQYHGIIVPGETLDLEETYCRRVIEDRDLIALSHASEQDWAEDPAYQTHGLDCYLGTPIHMSGDTVGTACFVDEDPRSKSFTDEERSFAKLLSFELGRLIERRRLKTRIDRHDELNAVLGRILRHNLRNELTVIRGRAELVAAQLDDELADDLDAVLDRVDALEAIAEKSRIIDTTISPATERQHVQLGELLTTVVDRVQEEYPDASFETVLSDITVPLANSMEQALKELIENAAKHGGDSPIVEIRTKTVEDGVVIEIADNGPGLPAPERRVFEDTIETPLEHGSGLGLWLVSWIVDNHDGDVDVAEFADGTRLRLRLPYTEGTL